MRMARGLAGVVVLLVYVLAIGSTGRAMEGPGGGEANPFASLETEASANFFTGAASVTVPIPVPPGRKRTTPELALHYSSHAGLSFAGLGWSLPLGVVSRATENGTPVCEGPDPEDFRVALSGSANRLVRVDANRFLLEYDEGWAEAIPDRAGNRWTVRTRDGMTYTFGDAEDARVHQGQSRFFDAASCQLTTAWYVTRLEDPDGNRIEIDWKKSGNTPLPDRIQYGGNAAAGIAHPFRIRFESEDLTVLGRPIQRMLASGVDQQLVRRLRRIVVEARSRAADAFEEVRRYELGYDDSPTTAEFLLGSIAASGLPVRRFHYASPTPTIVAESSEPVPDAETLGASIKSLPFLALMELNGDGLLDRLCVSSAGVWHAAYGEPGAVQFTGDSACTGAGSWRVPSIPGLALDRISKIANEQDLYFTQDLDGDGVPDLARRVLESDEIQVHRGSCASAYDCGFSDRYEVWRNPYPASDRALRRTVTGTRGTETIRDVVDLDGDGRPDLVAALANGDWSVYRNTGSGFASKPRILRGVDTLIAYAPNNHQNAVEERALIDVNDDGLVDWVSGVRTNDPLGSPNRTPEIYFGVGPAGETTGPFPLVGGPYLCPPRVQFADVSLCTGSGALPSGWAIVGAAAVRLNTGAGFSAPIYTPAPFWYDAHETANRLRGSWTSNSSRTTYGFRDFVDVNGDGRVDWVSSAVPWDASNAWYVLFNQGDGRFGGGLQLVAPAAPSSYGVFFGRVRPARAIADAGTYLSRSFQHAQPDNRIDREMMVFDIDADGLPERVEAFGFGGGDRWGVTRLRFADEEGHAARPHLLTRIDDGVGGTTQLRYAPSSRFVPSAEVAPRLPFVAWLLTAVRRTDGLCDTAPTDWFSLAGNPCLAAGHEIVRRLEYDEGVFDASLRQFLGFARTRVFDGPAGTGSMRELVFHQSDALEGKLRSESLYAGGVDLLARTTYDWRTSTDGARTQIFLQEQRVEEFVLHPQFGAQPSDSQCVVHRSSLRRSNGAIDPKTRIQTTCSMACAGAGDADQLCAPTPPGKKQVETTWADPIAGATHPVWDRPAQIVTSHVTSAGQRQVLASVQFQYDGIAVGSVDRGRLFVESNAIDASGIAWTYKIFEYDGGTASGPGNVTSLLTPVTGEARVATRIAFDPEFALHPILEIGAVSNIGASAERRVESRFDWRHGKKTETVGLSGRGAGDVAGTVYDALGRPVCEYAPGTVCGSTSGFGASAEYRYVYGTPDASDPLERLSMVELRRREPNAPGGFLVTRSYFDALGRERIATNQQYVVDPSTSGAGPSLQTVVARRLEYGPNGKPTRLHAPYVASGSGLSFDPPAGSPVSETSYVLNGNAAGRLDPSGRVFESTAFDGSRVRAYYHGRIHRRIDGIDADSPGHHTLERLDEHGRVVLRQSFERASTLLAQWNGEYDGRDQLVAEWYGDSNATRITRRFDLLGRAVETLDPDAGRWSVRYDEVGNEVFRDDPKPGESIQSCYDGMNRIVLRCVRASDAPDPGLCASAAPVCTLAYRYRYDEATPLLSTPNYGLGRLTTVEGPDSRHRYVYDVRGRVVLAVDEVAGESAATRYGYRPDLDRLETMTYPDGEIVRHGYDVSGQLAWLSQIDAAGNWLAYYVSDVSYDLRGRPVSLGHGNGTTDRFEYHGAREGFSLARLSTRSLGGKVFDPRTVYADLVYPDYDANGRLRRIDDLRNGSPSLSMTAAFAYDGAGRLTSVTGPNAEAFAYDPIGNLRAIDGQAFSQSGAPSPATAMALGPHQFDRLGDPSSLHFTFSYDENGRRTAKRRSDGAVDERYEYDAFGALRRLVVQGTPTIMGYAHDGRRVSETRDGITRRSFGRHAESVNGVLQKYYYVGDRLVATRKAASTAADPSAATVGGIAGAGKWLARPAPTPDLARRVVSTPAAQMVATGAAALLLLIPLGPSRRALGLRVARSGVIGSSLLVFVVSLPVVVPMLGCVFPADARHYHLDHLGSPIAITGPTGELELQYRYSAYGKVRRFDGEGAPASRDATSRREFGGYESDASSGLQYASSRWYDATTASFLTPDPADSHASPYAFVDWDPANDVDPNGALPVAALILLALSAVLVVASAIATGIQTGSVSAAFTTFGIGVAGLAAGFLVGLAAPAAAVAGLVSASFANAVNAGLAVASIGASIYGVVAAEDTAGIALAGAGLALSLAGAAYALDGVVRGRSQAMAAVAARAMRFPTGAPPRPDGMLSVGRRFLSPQTAQRLALEAQRRMVALAQHTALQRVRAAIAEIRAHYLGRLGVDVYAEVTIEGPRIPHPTRLFGEHLLPNRVDVQPVVVPTGRGPTPTLLAPVPWDRFRIHEFVPVLKNGAAAQGI